MKNASQIISSIQNKPQFSKLSKYKCIAKIQSMFLPQVQRMIQFAYIKNDTLFFVFNHPAGKQEFDNSIDNIKSALKHHQSDECRENTIHDIKAFVTHTPKLKKEMPLKIEQQIYTERAKGNFSNTIADPKLHELVRSIQKIIQEKQCH